MKHTLKTTIQRLRINASAGVKQRKALPDEFAKCAAGTCSCPTPHYEKLKSIDVSSQLTGVTIDLKVKPGQAIDLADIERCLEHTARQIGG